MNKSLIDGELSMNAEDEGKQTSRLSTQGMHGNSSSPINAMYVYYTRHFHAPSKLTNTTHRKFHVYNLYKVISFITHDHDTFLRTAGSEDLSLTSKPRLYELDRIKGNGKTVKVISRVAAKWEEVATRLHFEGHDISRIKKDEHYQSFDACRSMFVEWLEGKGRTPTTWETIIKVLEEVELANVASDLRDTLGV